MNGGSCLCGPTDLLSIYNSLGASLLRYCNIRFKCCVDPASLFRIYSLVLDSEKDHDGDIPDCLTYATSKTNRITLGL